MTTPRLFIDLPLSATGSVPLDRAQLHYLTQVLRRRAGDPVLVFNGRDGEWQATLEISGRHAGSLQAVEMTRPQCLEPGPTLYLAPPKRPRLEWLLEKATELGVGRIQPVITERTVSRLANPDRLGAQIIEAAEQCRRLTVPELAEPLPLAAALARRDAGDRLLFADERGGEALADALRSGRAPSLLIGPEGGFTEAERAVVRAASKVIPVSLGPTILRTETAAIMMLAGWRAFAGSEP
jgi:16S rRNA (uracil1498-N3)-methyltransferase